MLILRARTLIIAAVDYYYYHLIYSRYNFILDIELFVSH